MNTLAIHNKGLALGRIESLIDSERIMLEEMARQSSLPVMDALMSVVEKLSTERRKAELEYEAMKAQEV